MKVINKIKNDFKIILLDTRSNPITGAARVKIREHNPGLITVKLDRKVSSGEIIKYPMEPRPGSVYSITVTPDNYRTIQKFVIQQSSGTDTLSLRLPVNPGKVKEAVFITYQSLPDKLRSVLVNSAAFVGNNVTAEKYYSDLSDLQKAGLFNLYAKMNRTLFANEENVFDHVISLREVHPARIYAIVDPELIGKVSADNKLFRSVSGLKHKFPDDFKMIGSYKTSDDYGILQLTIAKNNNKEEFMVDADIDNSSGLLHIFDVIKHKITKSDSHPYDIREILIIEQNLDPGYHLIV